MNKSDLEKMQKCQEEYEKYLKESPLHSVIDEIAKDIRDRQDNIMAMEFTRTIAELLRENGIVVNCTEHSCTKDLSDKSIEKVYGVIFDSVDCTKHDRQFTDRIAELEKENNELNVWCQKYKIRADEYRVCILPRATEKAKRAIDERDFLSIRIETTEENKEKNEKIKNLFDENIQLKAERNDLSQQVEKLKEKISELESELSEKENLLKIKNGLCGESELRELTPIEVAEKLINAESEYETNSIQRAFGAGEKEKYNIFSVSELRQIAEHLLVYCNYQKENENE